MSFKKYLLIGFSILILIILAVYPSNKISESDEKNIESEASRENENLGLQDYTLNFENTNLDSIKKYTAGLEKSPPPEEKEGVKKEEEESIKQESEKESKENLSLDVKSPENGDVFYRNSEIAIEWESSNDMEKIDILLEKFPFKCSGDSSCESLFYSSNSPRYIASDTEDDGSFSWLVEEDSEPGKYRIEVNNSNPIQKVSDVTGVFSISDRDDQLKVEFPIEEYGLNQGGDYTIVWSGGDSVFNLEIILIDESRNNEIVLADQKENNGVFIWSNTKNINGDTVPEGNYYLILRSLTNQVESNKIPITIK